MKNIIQDAYVDSLGGSKRYLGDAAWIHAEGIDIVIHSARTQNTMPHFFEALGIDPMAQRILIVKSMQHFRAAFQLIAREVLICDAGALSSKDIAKLPFTKLRRPIFPIDLD